MIKRKDDLYFKQLVELVDGGDMSYNNLFILHQIPFVPNLIDDINRINDVYSTIREEYNYPVDIGVSVLEVLIGMAMRLEEFYDDPRPSNSSSYFEGTLCFFFWEMIANLGLGDLDDEKYHSGVVIDVINKWINRTYEPTGKGSPLPIKDILAGDQRNMTIWELMNLYFGENFMEDVDILHEIL